MSLFSSPEEHAANSPDTWLVVKGGVRDSWHLTTTAGVVLETKTTRRAAEAAREGGFCARLYDVERRWYAGDQVANYRPWAEVKAEQERNAARQAVRLAARPLVVSSEHAGVLVSAIQAAFDADMAKMAAAIQKAGAVVDFGDGTYGLDSTRLPQLLTDTYRRLLQFGYANGLIP